MNEFEAALAAAKERHPEYFDEPEVTTAGTGWPEPPTEDRVEDDIFFDPKAIADRTYNSNVTGSYSHH